MAIVAVQRKRKAMGPTYRMDNDEARGILTGYLAAYRGLSYDGAIRVIGSIDDGGWRAFRPLSDDFIRAPDGTFVGE